MLTAQQEQKYPIACILVYLHVLHSYICNHQWLLFICQFICVSNNWHTDSLLIRWEFDQAEFLQSCIIININVFLQAQTLNSNFWMRLKLTTSTACTCLMQDNYNKITHHTGRTELGVAIHHCKSLILYSFDSYMKQGYLATGAVSMWDNVS